MSPHSSTRPAVLITGASSGIGEACVEQLAASGFLVFAGVRSEAARSRWADVSNVEPVELDVTSPAHVNALVHEFERRLPAGLAGLINNAGTALAGPLELVSLDEIQRQFNVNVFGLLRVTQAMLPLLRNARGRVINIGSASAATPFPFTGAYAASKAAVAAIDDVLALELRSSGVTVALIESGRIATPIWSKALATLPAPCKEDARFSSLRASLTRSSGLSSDVVADVVLQALTVPKMRRRYLVGPDACRLARLRWLPRFIREAWILRRTGLPSGPSDQQGATH